MIPMFFFNVFAIFGVWGLFRWLRSKLLEICLRSCNCNKEDVLEIWECIRNCSKFTPAHEVCLVERLKGNNFSFSGNFAAKKRFSAFREILQPKSVRKARNQFLVNS